MVNRSERQLIEVIEDNRFEAFGSLGQSPYVDVQDEPEMLKVFTNITILSPLCGWIFRVNLSENEIERKIDQTINDFKSRKLPVIWNTGPSTRPANLRTYLLRYGFSPVFQLAGMATSLDSLPQFVDTPANLEIISVTNPDDLMKWAETFTAGFSVAGNVETAVFQLFESLVFNPDIPWHLFLAVLDNTAVATSAMYLGAGVAGIYFVTTIPKARRQGIGTQITLTALSKALEIGYETAVLHAAPGAVNIYRSLGFEEFCQMGLFARKING